MEHKVKTPYRMDLISASKTKLYNQGLFWAFNTAKYRALMSNDPIIIKAFYRREHGTFLPDTYNAAEIKRSFYYGDDFVENAEEFFGIIPMICESLSKMVSGSGYTFDEVIMPEIKERVQAITDDNNFDTEILSLSIVETLGLGSPAWHVHFDPKTSNFPIIELIPVERLEIKKKHGRIIEYIIKNQATLNGQTVPYEIHTCYTKRKKQITTGGSTRYQGNGIEQIIKLWNGTKYIENDFETKRRVFKENGVTVERAILPLNDYPVIYLPNTLKVQNATTINKGPDRPYGIVFGLESVSSAIDETLSNCVDTIRKSFPFLLIDQKMIPANIEGDREKGAFSTRRHSFVTPLNSTEPEKLLQQIQARLNTTEFVESLKFQINIALNKVGLNAATLGLQLSGHVEAESTQNAKERNSIRTRNDLAADYESYMSKLFNILLQYEDYINGSIVAIDNETGEEAIVINDYGDIKVHFNKYIIDTPEEISVVLARKVQSNLMSIYDAVREQHPDWDEEKIIKSTNIIYAESGRPIQVVNESKPISESAVIDNETIDNDEDIANG